MESKLTTDKYGTKIWCNEKGEWHREDGPAFEYANGNKFWRINGKLHREDGPAAEYPNGNKYWYLNNVELTKEGYHLKLISMNICPLDYQKFDSKDALAVHFDDHFSKGKNIPNLIGGRNQKKLFIIHDLVLEEPYMK